MTCKKHPFIISWNNGYTQGPANDSFGTRSNLLSFLINSKGGLCFAFATKQQTLKHSDVNVGLLNDIMCKSRYYSVPFKHTKPFFQYVCKTNHCSTNNSANSTHYVFMFRIILISLAVRSKALVRLLGSGIRIPPGRLTFVSCVYCVLSR